jgi:penicillin V acylase-like amidase (Ntn superfamily)
MCTDLLIVSETVEGQKLVVNARSQEFDTPIGYRLMVRREGVMVQVTHPNRPHGRVSLEQIAAHSTPVDLCVSKYDYIGVVMTTLRAPWNAISTAIFDGMNAAGLSVGGLNAPGSQYEARSTDPKTQNVFIGFLADWLLAQYATCEEVKAAFADGKLRAVSEIEGFEGEDGIKAVESNVKLHFAVHDAQGHSLAIEFLDGKANVTDNPVKVLTNLPALSWHLTNLGLYAHLSNFSSHEPVDFGGVIYSPPGSLSPTPAGNPPAFRSTGIPGLGDGLAGIPGDFRPASRFVRAAYLKHFALPPRTRDEAVSQAFHLMNAVDMVMGSTGEKSTSEGAPDRYDTPQIIMVKDLANKVFYLRMYESPMPYSIAFADLDDLAPHTSPNGTQLTIPTTELATRLPHSVYAA